VLSPWLATGVLKIIEVSELEITSALYQLTLIGLFSTSVSKFVPVTVTRVPPKLEPVEGEIPVIVPETSKEMTEENFPSIAEITLTV